MKEKNRAVLKKAIHEMPSYKLENINFWERFDSHLHKADTNHYENAVGNLPAFRAPEKLWERIEPQLDKKPHSRQLRFVHPMFRVAAVAALLLLVGFGSIYINHRIKTSAKQATFLITKTRDLHDDDPDPMPVWNPALCESNPRICNTELFKSLDKQLVDVKDELLSMKPMIRNNDPQMLKYYFRLVNLRVEIEKKMVKIIMES